MRSKTYKFFFVFALLFMTGCNWHLKTRTETVAIEKMAPGFSLPDQNGENWSLEKLLADGPAVVVFYRGFW